jgi:hypothetical protein
MKPPKTIRGLMLCIAIVGLLLGLAKNAAPFFPLIVVVLVLMTPQIIIIAICAYLAVRDERKQLPPNSPDRFAPRSSPNSSFPSLASVPKSDPPRPSNFQS